jgi:hypothetical protein
MAYIAPNSDVWLCRGVPLDSRSKYTYRPSSKNEQFEAFNAYSVYTLTAQSYIRHSNNTIRVAIAPDLLLTCNYMMFRNTSFGSKIFYAFITDVDYVNNETSLITYSIDNIQTYFFDVSFNASYIEREHCITDNIGDSITPEPVITSGQEVISHYNDFSGISKGCYTVVVTSHDIENPVKEEYYFSTGSTTGSAGIIVAGQTNVFKITDGTSALAAWHFVDNYIQKVGESGILAIYTIPRIAYTGDFPDGNGILKKGANILVEAYQSVENPKPKVTDTLNGYLPKNNKLYTYPFCFLRCQNNLGTQKDFRYEFFSSDNAIFRITSSSVSPDQTVYCTPERYRGYVVDWENSLSYDNFPASSFVTGEYSNYVGNNSNRIVAGQAGRIVDAIFTTAGSLTTGNVLAGISGLASNFMQGVQEQAFFSDLKGQTSVLGSLASGWLNILYDQILFKAYRVEVNASVAKQYDDFFTMYGYTVNALKVPQFAQAQRRKAYNYCKTKNACVRSLGATSLGIPDTAIKDIQTALDGGLCLWETLANVGNYSVDNSL